jgi:hypothetical protein
MSKSSSRSSGFIEIEALEVSNVIIGTSNIHHVQFDLIFNANMTSNTGDIVVKIVDNVGATIVEDITTSLTFTPNSTLSYQFDYSLSNSNIKILTPKEPTDTSSKNSIIVEFNGDVLLNQDIEVDSCKKYFQNINSGGTPTFDLGFYDFNNSMNFDLYSYIVDGTDTIKMYCKGLPSEIGIKETFTTITPSLSDSTATISYDIASNIVGLGNYNYSLSSTDDIQIEIEKPTFSDNNIFNIVNASTLQTIDVYMYNVTDGIQSNFNTDVNWSSAGETHTIEYRLFNPVWKDIVSSDNIQPSVNITGDISNYINGITVGFINNGEINVTIIYEIDSGTSISVGDTNNYNGIVTVSLNDFSITSGTTPLVWTSTVTI